MNRCLPKPCTVYCVQPNDTINSIAKAYQYSNYDITKANLAGWNAALDDDASNLVVGDSYCFDQPGGRPTPRIITGMHYPTAPSATAKPSSSPSAVPKPSPVPSGIISTCNQYAVANSGGSCQAFSTRNNISLAQLYSWNGVFGPHGENCTTMFKPGTYYCTGVTGPLRAPGPAQRGVIDTCIQYLRSNAGGTCAAFASRAGISLSNLYAWNSVLGSTGQNCASKFIAFEYYCVAVAGPADSTAPLDPYQPRQDGLISTCNKYAKSNSDGTCQYFLGNQNITAAQLYAWNSVLGYHGENCATKFLGNEYYCIGVSGPLPAPGAVQAGVIDTCIKYAKSNADGSCQFFPSNQNITSSQLYAWNPVLGKNGENCSTKFLGNEYYCVAVAG